MTVAQMMHDRSDTTAHAALVKQKLQSYLTPGVARGPEEGRTERLAWRLSCFDSGLDYVRYVEEHWFGIKGKRVLDLACGWGGHAVAFACEGAQAFASDLNDHNFSSLTRFSNEQNLNMVVLRADCVDLPFTRLTFDVVIALELVEHLAFVDAFATEVVRVLRPGGICLISTPPKLRSLVQGEPHYGIKGVTMLPLSWQKVVASKLLGRSYPYPIPRQYTTASKVIQPFVARGLHGVPVLRGRLADRLKDSPFLLRLAQELFWSFLVVEKPTLLGFSSHPEASTHG